MSPSRRVLSLLAAFALLLGLAAVGTPALAADPPAAPGVGWTAYPKQNANDKTLRTSFFFEAQAGSTLRDAVVISNLTTAALPLDVYGSDGYNATGGGAFGVRSSQAKPEDVGAWIDLTDNKVTIPKRKAATIPFTLKIPDSARPGDHIGGIVTLDTRPQAGGDAGSNVKVQKAVAVKMYVRVSGDLQPGVEVSSVNLNATPAALPFVGSKGKATVTFVYTNIGNLTLRLSAKTTLKGALGRTLHTTDYESVPEIFPGQSVTLTRAFDGMPPLDYATATVDMKTTEPLLGYPDGVTASGDSSAFVWSGVFLAVLLVVIVLIGLYFFVWRRRKSAKPAAGPATAPAAGVGSPL